jgi:hypothetical protein
LIRFVEVKSRPETSLRGKALHLFSASLARHVDREVDVHRLRHI